MIGSVLVASVLIVASLPQTPSAPPGQQLPTFRSAVDVVELDITVLDKDRHPVKGLTADDFTILDRGKPQPIVAFSAVDVPGPISYPAPWMRDAPIDVVSNVENRRLVTIVMDDAYTGASPGITKRAKDVAYAAIKQLGPRDLASVVFTFTGRMQNFTADRSALIRAVDSFVPKLGSGDVPLTCDPRLRSCDIETLSTVASTLITAPPGRKMLILVSGGRNFAFGQVGLGGVPSSAAHANEGAGLVAAFNALQRGNVTVYAFDASGLRSGGMSTSRGAATVSLDTATLSANDSLHSFAESTGGRAVINTNYPAGKVADAFKESSTYYFVGFRSTTVPDRPEFRKIEVKLNRPEFNVRTRNGYYTVAKTSGPVDVINGLPGGDLPLRATAAVFAVPGQKAAEVILATGVDEGGEPSDARTIDLSATAVDLDGKPCGTQQQSIVTSPSAGSASDLPAHLPLKEGRYLVQLSAQSEGRSGVVVVDVDVPDFSRDALSASGLIVGRPSGSPVTDKVLADLIPFLPTAQRQFQPKDDVAAFLRVYQGGQGKIAPVRISAKVTDDKNVVRSNQQAVIDATGFSADRSAAYQVSLPLAKLSAGDYLLEVDAESDGRHVRRTARFSVVADR
jgi:VWFA-related protein